MSRENGALRVLLLEDSPTDAELLAARLRSAGLGVDLTRVDSREEFAAIVGDRYAVTDPNDIAAAPHFVDRSVSVIVTSVTERAIVEYSGSS